MRRLLPVVLFLAATTLSAQLQLDRGFHGESADGTQLVAEMPAAAGGVIVEFRDAPLVLRAASTERRVMLAGYRDTFDRFRNDVATILAHGSRRVVEPDIRWEYFETFNGVALTVPRADVDALRALPYVKAVHPDVTVRAFDDEAAPSDNIKKINADQLWAQSGTRGAGVVIAIIDTGIDYRHPALGGGFGPGFRVIGGYDFVNKDNDPMDDHFHGTHVAGIAAGRSSDLIGVAPEASLIAFKVLGSTGSGKESDVLAAIERTVDPNGDGDTRDRVDVANLSLGGSGSPDDPQSIAIDNATAAGVVFAVAAGNSGASFHTIGSPGTARRAITVGAVDVNDNVASFTSRGPDMKTLAIKPEVMAPGVSIRSSLPNGTYGSLSGTSMATPHIAGVAALLKAAHRDWTPAQIKSAIVNSASDVFTDLMTQGGGRVNALAAAGSTLFFDPPLFSLGLDPPKSATWTSSSTVRVTNGGSQSATVSLTPASIGGVKATLSPSSLTIAAGQSADLTMSVEVTNAFTSGHASSFSVGGQAAVTGGGLHLPFGFTRAARVTVDYDRDGQETIWFAPTFTVAAASLDDRSSEAIFKPGPLDLLLFAVQSSDSSPFPTDAQVIYRENQDVDGDMHLPISGTEAKHLVTLKARDEKGALLLDHPQWHVALGRLLLHSDWQLRSLQLPPLQIAAVHISDLVLPKLLVTDELFDNDNNHAVAVQFPAIATPSSDLTLTNDPSAVKSATVRLFIPPWSHDSSTRITMSPVVGVGDDTSGAVALLTLNATGAPETDWTLGMNADVLAGYSLQTRFSMNADGRRMYDSPPLSALSDRLATVTAAPWSYDGDTFTFGFGPNLPVTRVSPSTRAVVNTIYIGQFGETRGADATTVQTTVTAGNAAPFTVAGTNGSIDLSTRGPVRVDVTQRGLMSGAVARTTSLTMQLDTTRIDYSPPTFTSLTLLDANGRGTNRLEPHGGGTLRFSVTDYVDGNGVYQQIRPEATAAFYRVSGTSAWLPLTVVQVAEDGTSSSNRGPGILYRADLRNAANVDRALVDIRIDATDVAGNSASVAVQPAFSVGADVPPRHRAAGR